VLEHWYTSNEHTVLRQNAIYTIRYYLYHYSVPRALRSPTFEALLVQLAQSIEDCINRASADAAVYAAADTFNARVQCVAEQFIAHLSQTRVRKRKSSAISATNAASNAGSSSDAPLDGHDSVETDPTGMSNVIIHVQYTLHSIILSMLFYIVLYTHVCALSLL
jgi:CRISPR/Cas system-associated exonuclease Cas4 (RecB family)